MSFPAAATITMMAGHSGPSVATDSFSTTSNPEDVYHGAQQAQGNRKENLRYYGP